MIGNFLRLLNNYQFLTLVSRIYEYSNQRWTDLQVFKLIEIWRINDEKLKSCNRRIALEDMRKELQNERINKTVYQITKKMDNLRQNYKKNRPASTGGEPSTSK
ncbi:hypothetical protein BLOT_006305 [Blomia tropicalis]|nr:hypothetical protein BLOT_006305 [Blomia tropicalis]